MLRPGTSSPPHAPTPAKAPILGGPWSPGTISIPVVNEGKTSTIRVKAQVWGYIAVHPDTLLGSDRWSVTHVPTGLRIATLATEIDAKQVAAVVYNYATLAMTKPTRSEATDELPFWVKEWVRSCRASGRYEPYEPWVPGPGQPDPRCSRHPFGPAPSTTTAPDEELPEEVTFDEAD